MAGQEKVRFGVIGAGRIGRIHIQNLCQRVSDAEVVVVCDVAVHETRQWAAGLGVDNVVADPQDVFNDRSVDAVVICSPTDLHAEHMMAAAKAGKDIFCEKPIAIELERTKQALKAVEDAGVLLQLGFNRRFDHNFQRIQQLVEQGALGDVHIVNITSRDPAPPPIEYVKVSGGIFMDMAIHDFDMARYMVGSEVVEVYAAANVLIDPEIGEAGDFDTAVTILKFANGATAVIDNSRQAVYGYDQRVEVFGSKGRASAENDTPTNVSVYTEDTVTSDKPLHFFLERYMGSFAKEMEDFASAVLQRSEPPVGGEDGLKSLLIAMAATKSAKENRPVLLADVAAH